MHSETLPATPDAECWDGYGTALKPSFELVYLCRAPRSNLRYVDLALQYGTGALNVDGCRVGTDDTTVRHNSSSSSYMTGEIGAIQPKQSEYTTGSIKGRYPPNTLLCHHPTCTEAACVEGCHVLEMGRQSGEGASKSGFRGAGINDPTFKAPEYASTIRGHNDFDTAARFYPQFRYAAKASRSERDKGLEGFEVKQKYAQDGSWASHEVFSGASGDEARRAKHPANPTYNPHPTLKPIAMNKWLATLLLPPPLDTPHRILIPFAGTMSEGVGAMQAGWDEIVGVETDVEYCGLAQARMRYWEGIGTQQKLF
jgi:site-specific DNA-methyltransferase (adenine-specific)